MAKVEKVLERGTEEIDDHCVVVAFGTEPTNKRDADTTGEGLVDLGLILELGVLGLDGLELDGDLLSGNDVNSEVDITYATRLGSCMHERI